MRVRTIPAVADDESVPMNGAELRVITEYLGLDQSALADYLDVSARTVRRWIAGATPVPDGVRSEIETLENYTDAAVCGVVAELREACAPSVTVYGEDDPEWGDIAASLAIERPVPARWWRMVVARAVREVPGVAIRYAGEVA